MEYKKLESARLKQLCTERALDPKGSKDVLAKRLKEWDLRNEPQLELGASTSETVPIIPSPTKPVSSTKRLFIQLKVSNISHYFNSGLIYPLALEESEVYVKENRKNDLFTLYPHYLLLSPAPVNELADDDALLDIAVDQLDLVEVPGSPIWYFGSPIPISRVKAIVFKTEQAKKGFVSSAKTFPDFFVEEKICHITSGMKPIAVDLKGITLSDNPAIDKWHDIMDRFDKIMGMFAFMKNAGVFYADREGVFEEYTANYFSALSVVNPIIKSQPTRDIPLYKYIIFPGEIETSTLQRVLFQKILKAIYGNIEMDLSFAREILQTALESGVASSLEKGELSEIYTLFEKLEARQISYKDLIAHQSIQRNYPVMALLFLSRFSNKSRQHTDKQAVRNNFMENSSPISKSISEFLMAVLGLYYGYKTMIKEDTNLNLIDPVFASLTRRHQSIKFRLSSYLDRFVIESAYWFSINGSNQPNHYPYLEFQPIEKRDTLTISSGAYEYQDASYPYRSTQVSVYKRVNKLDSLIESLDKQYPNQITANSALLQHLVSNFGLRKTQLFELMRENLPKIDVEALKYLIEFDKVQKNKM